MGENVIQVGSQRVIGFYHVFHGGFALSHSDSR
jgi:hypothetical protein